MVDRNDEENGHSLLIQYGRFLINSEQNLSASNCSDKGTIATFIMVLYGQLVKSTQKRRF